MDMGGATRGGLWKLGWLAWAGTWLFSLAQATAINPALLQNLWPARWVWVAGSDPFCYGVYHFRRTFELPQKPTSFIIHVTADNRYQLFVNGQRVVWGPARGDLFHWRFETVDIAPYLRAGKNVLAAVVWNDGEYRAVAQISHRTGFLLQGDGEAEALVNTGPDWRGIQNRAYQPIPPRAEEVYGYVVVPPLERFDASQYPWGWEQLEFDDSSWPRVAVGRNGAPRDTVDAPTPWFLVPREIPLMEETPQRLARVRLAEGITPPEGFPAKPVPLRIPARARVRLLLDQNVLTTAFPELVITGGKGARISVRYAEALWIPGQREKGHRDEIEGKEFRGYGDVILPDGGRQRLWRPLYWRTYRYIELVAETQADPLTIEDIRGVYTGYPFTRRAKFEGGPEELQKILEVGWRTARLCAHETYMDCPYYEQLQYVGDTRIQALVSLYMSGDPRLMRKAICDIDASRTAEGATFSRAPSALQQYIPGFSLWWIGMLHDYWRYVGEPAFVRSMLPGMRAVLAFFQRYQRDDGALVRLPWWNYVDWVERWPRGVPPGAPERPSAAIDLQLLLGYQWAAELEEALGIPEMAPVYRRQAERLKATIRRLYWDDRRQLFADTAQHDAFSQHANALAVLAGVVEGQLARQVIERALQDKDLAPASIYFRYYLHQAMAKAGLGDRYLDMLDIWRRQLANGLTTWAEREGFRVRSDCHAWGSSPNIELFRIVLGVDSADPGFSRVLIEPHLGSLSRVSGVVPHPAGFVEVSLQREGARLRATVHLPAGITGEFRWRGQRQPLRPGLQELVLEERQTLAP